MNLLLAFCLAAALAVFSRSTKLLTTGGAVVQLILGWDILAIGGWTWAWPILAFFFPSTLVSYAGRERKREIGTAFEKTGRRDARQVLANGGIAGLIMLLSVTRPGEYWFGAYVGALAAAASDTWATEIGVLSRSRPFLITTLKGVETGRSGAISPLGLASGLVGALLVGAAGCVGAVAPDPMFVLVSAAAGGIVGSLADSLAGATVQVQFRCTACGRLVERRSHCGRDSIRAKGVWWVNNDVVNTVCTAAGATAGLISWAF